MRFGEYEVSAGLWPTVATLLLLPLLTGMGIWQLERADWKQALVDSHAERAEMPPLALSMLDEFDESVQYRQVTVRGSYDTQHQLLLDNRTQQGHAGYHVLTPLSVASTDKVVLVNRGWVPVGQSRAQLPELPGPTGEIVVRAILKLPPEKLFRLGEVDESHSGWPKVVQQVKISDLEQRLGQTLLPVLLLLNSEDEFGFIRDWKPVYGTPPDKHRAYAAQWFTLAAVLLMIYIGVNTKKRVTRE